MRSDATKLDFGTSSSFSSRRARRKPPRDLKIALFSRGSSRPPPPLSLYLKHSCQDSSCPINAPLKNLVSCQVMFKLPPKEA